MDTLTAIEKAVGPHGRLRIGSWRVDLSAREFSDGFRTRHVSIRAAKVLAVLVEANGAVVGRADLIDAVWPDLTVSEESLTTAISELRRAFDDRPGADAIIQTVHRSGYRLRAAVARDGDIEALRENGTGFDLEAFAFIQESLRLCFGGTPDSLERAEALGELAARKANRFAPAHAQFAVSSGFRYLFAAGGTNSLARAGEAAETALGLRPDLAISHAAMAYAFYSRGAHDQARHSIAQAFAIDPNDAIVHTIAHCTLYGIGDHRTAGAIAERTASLRAEDYYSLGIAARSAAALGETDRALALARFALARLDRWLAIDPSDKLAGVVRGAMLAMVGRSDEAVLALNEEPFADSLIGFYKALILSRIGEVTPALNHLQQVIDGGWRHWNVLRVEPLLANVHGEQRFRAMVPTLN